MSEAISWPARFQPGRVAARVRNEITIAAPPDVVWDCLIAAAEWPAWYANSADMRIEGGGADLAADTVFTWRTFGVTVRCQVREWVPPSRIAWDGQAAMLDVYHAWVIEARPGGCWVLTEEHQNGLLARAQALFMPGRMFRGHALWLEKLKERAEARLGGA